jgi:hypothetical protein
VTIRAYQHLGRVPKASTVHTAQGQLWEQDEQP